MKKKHLNFQLVIYCIVLTLSCSQKNLSDYISKRFNEDICDNFAYRNGGMNIGMKYLLDSIINKFSSTNMDDTKHCIFYTNTLRRHTASVYFFDSKDTLYFKLDEEETKGIPGKYRLNNKIHEFFFSIKIKKLESEILKKSNEYIAFFDSTSNNTFLAKKLSFDGVENVIILRMWQIDQNKTPYIEFFEFLGDSLIKKPFTKMKKEDKRFKLKVY